jgi:lysozyme
MTKKQQIYFSIGAAVLLLIILPMKANATALMSAIRTSLNTFLPKVESFSATPYWDYKQWSWGYGTRVPGSVPDKTIKPAGTITREQAAKDMAAHFTNDLLELMPLVTRQLTANQWTAYLSFSYNTGIGNAKNLLADINAGNDAVLEIHWKKYIYAGGVVNTDLIARRAKEWQLWIQK